MSSVAQTPPYDSDIQELKGRISALEQQHRNTANLQAQTLSEVRSFREDFQRYAQGMSEELTRLYRAVLGT